MKDEDLDRQMSAEQQRETWNRTMRNLDVEQLRYGWKCGFPAELCKSSICNECGERRQGFADLSKGVFRCLDCWSKIVVPDHKTLDVEDFARI